MTFELNHRSVANPVGKILLVCVVLLALSLAPLSAIAKGGSDSPGTLERYIIELQDPPLSVYDGRELSVASRGGLRRLKGTAVHITREKKLNTRSPRAREYLEFVSARHEEFQHEVSRLLGRPIAAAHLYRLATNGMAIDIDPEEAAILARSPLVKSLARDVRYELQTYAGPQWIGAGEIWTGDAGFPEMRGENIVVGVIDTGINWDHQSFDNPSPLDGYVYNNPLGGVLGLCNDPTSGAKCNGKLIGVYDFVQDNPFTEDVVEENTNGWDNDQVGHGSHTASTAAGNPVNTVLEGSIEVTVSGVAPRANIISYRVCHTGEPISPGSDGCMGSAILSAIDQAIEDGVDVINFSIGNPNAEDPWSPFGDGRAYLNAREAGIFVATSAGNDGPTEGTITSPANAPWVVAVGYATHNVLPGNSVKNLVGGNSTPPDDLVGVSLTGGTGQKQIVHARDYGNALCGAGEAELQGSCTQNQGLSNPWEGQTPFNGEIVVCDRGTYGRIEKGKNVLLAGAGGYILANTGEQGESIVADEHCLPAIHVGQQDGDELRAWLASGSGHGGMITDFTLVEHDSFGDQLSSNSSRGPANSPVENILKPNVIAPGASIYAASNQGQAFRILSGSSMSSPHVAGAAALLKSVHPDWNVNQISSAIETTATAEFVTVDGNDFTSPQERGAGRPQIAQAAHAGVYLKVTADEFEQANPAVGGQPRNLNLPGLVDSRCPGVCSFVRRVTDQIGGGDWTATAVGFPDAVDVTVNPANFSLGDGQTQELVVDIDFSQSGIFDQWVSGSIRLSASGSPDQFLTVTVKGDVPAGWTLTDDRNGGWEEFLLFGLADMPDATFTSGALLKPGMANLFQDPTDDDPYDGGVGVFTTWHSLPQGGSWLYAQTLASTALDLDLFVGRDDNGNGLAEASEELCFSTSPDAVEECNLYNLQPGDYWILVQNWFANEAGGDLATVAHAAIAPSEDNNFSASGPGIIAEGESFPVRLSWNNIDALPGEQFFGAVAIGSNRNNPTDIGMVPVRFERSAIAEPETFPLMSGTSHHLAIDANDTHDRLFIDVAPGASSLTVFTNGADEEQSNGLTLELKRLSFEDGMSDPPFATPAGDAPALVSASGMGGVGPSITVIGVDPGRWYPVLSNNNDSPSAVEIRATAQFEGPPLAAHPGLWEPGSRPGLGQGYDYNQGGSSRALIWYTYGEDGQPSWYIAANPVSDGNIWTADLLRFTNDGSNQQSTPVGRVSITILAGNDAMFSYTLFGQSGTERMQPISPLTCPQINGSAGSYTGIWYPGFDGLGGASVLVSAITQAQIHYLFDESGMPRWLFAQDLVNPEPTNSELPMLQFSGYCAVCEAAAVSSVAAGVLERSFDSETTGSWTLDYLFKPPLSGSANRTNLIIKLTDTLSCQ